MTLGNMREKGVRTLAINCERCHHDAVLDVSSFPDDVPVPTFGPRMVCTRCGGSAVLRNYCGGEFRRRAILKSNFCSEICSSAHGHEVTLRTAYLLTASSSDSRKKYFGIWRIDSFLLEFLRSVWSV
jgi:hypothetical protein